MQLQHAITPCLWFDSDAEDAANFYVEVFSNAKIIRKSHFGDEGHETHGRPAGSVLEVVFELNGQTFSAINGGPFFKITEAISFQIFCETQEEIDYYWETLRAGGDEKAQQCGWLKDKFGVSWQVIPAILNTLINDSDYARKERVMAALMKMHKLEINALIAASEG